MDTKTTKPQRPFRRAVFRGLGVILPPLLTILFLLWVWNSVQKYVVSPIESLAQKTLVNRISEVYDEPPVGVKIVDEAGRPRSFRHGEKVFTQLPTKQWIPREVSKTVLQSPGAALPTTAEAFYERYVQLRWLKPSVVLPMIFCLFLMLVYLLGKFIAARVGRIFVETFERMIDQLPFVGTVYGTVKQVTDIAFSDKEVEFTRAVAVEYPRKGMWSVGFVTGESMPVIADAAGEPVISVLMPTSPAPFTGFTITVRKSETIELNITRDQAFQFVVSCGVVRPGQKSGSAEDQVNEAIAASTAQRRAAPGAISTAATAPLPTTTDSTS
jgi:uncharacterized membrane protein